MVYNYQNFIENNTEIKIISLLPSKFDFLSIEEPLKPFW